MTVTRSDLLTREAWLLAAVEDLRPMFAQVGATLPKVVRVSTGFGWTAKGENTTILGQTFATAASDDKIPSVFIVPTVDDSLQVLGILVHELIHVADDVENGHKGRFAEFATMLGCKGPMTQALPDVALEAELILLAESLGDYPHKAIDLVKVRGKAPVGPDGQPVPTAKRTHSGPAKQGTRMLKVQCVTPDCACGGYVVRTTAKWLEVGTPSCPMGSAMKPQS